MPMPIDSSKLKRILLERRSYPLMIGGALLFFGGAYFFKPSWPALIGWIIALVGVIEYFRGFR